ncbi:MAG: hypothetical protein ABEH81_05200 [Halopenitus sp.]
MDRRSLLEASAAVLVPLTGCSGLEAPESGDSSATESGGSTQGRPPADDALVIESSIAVEGTMVNVGAEGTAKNAASTALVDCVVAVSGIVGGETYRAQAHRDRLAPGQNWEWQVAFGEQADASNDDSVETLSIETRAEYPK